MISLPSCPRILLPPSPYGYYGKARKNKFPFGVAQNKKRADIGSDDTID